MLKFKFTQTELIKNYLTKIDALRIVFDTLPSLPIIEESIRRESLLRSSLFSARIEGNPLTLIQAKNLSVERVKDLKKLEVFNLLSAYRLINSGRTPAKLTTLFVKKLHGLVMKGISDFSGKYRTEPWTVYDSVGNAVYIAPLHSDVPSLITDMVEVINHKPFDAPINAGLVQFLFEKVHPFADGNGRVGRLLSAYVLHKSGFGLRGMVSSEEYIDKNRSEYYRCLEPQVNATIFVEFFLKSIVEQARITLDKLKNYKEESEEDLLLPRRREILEIVRDHPYSSFNFLSRWFVAVNPKTLHYDLKKLQDEGFIVKIGKTRGVTYKAR